MKTLFITVEESETEPSDITGTEMFTSLSLSLSLYVCVWVCVCLQNDSSNTAGLHHGAYKWVSIRFCPHVKNDMRCSVCVLVCIMCMCVTVLVFSVCVCLTGFDGQSPLSFS